MDYSPRDRKEGHNRECFFTEYVLISPLAAAAKSLQLCLTLCDPIDGSPPGSPVPGILQERVLQWGAIAFSQFLT